MRTKVAYKITALDAAIEKICKEAACQVTGKDDYEMAALTIKLKVEEFLADYLDQAEKELWDLSTEIDKRVESRMDEFIESDEYSEARNILLDIETARIEWVEDFLGKEAAKNYTFGDTATKTISDGFKLGDFTKKVFKKIRNIFWK